MSDIQNLTVFRLRHCHAQGVPALPIIGKPSGKTDQSPAIGGRRASGTFDGVARCVPELRRRAIVMVMAT
jgi:hypothetical protein